MNRQRKSKESIIEKMGGRNQVIAMIIVAVLALGIGITWIEIDARKRWEAQWIASYPMANQHIEWHYAEVKGE